MEKKFLNKLGSAHTLGGGGREPERRRAKTCRRHNSTNSLAKTRRRYRQGAEGISPSTLSAGTELIPRLFGAQTRLFKHICVAESEKFRRASLFCPDELDSLFSYFDTGSGPRSKFPS